MPTLPGMWRHNDRHRKLQPAVKCQNPVLRHVRMPHDTTTIPGIAVPRRQTNQLAISDRENRPDRYPAHYESRPHFPPGQICRRWMAHIQQLQTIDSADVGGAQEVDANGPKGPLARAGQNVGFVGGFRLSPRRLPILVFGSCLRGLLASHPENGWHQAP